MINILSMIGTLLQIDPQIQSKVDTLVKHIPAKEQVIEQIKTDPVGFMHQFGQSAIDFGMKLLAALAIYFIGAWLIKYLRRFLNGFFARKHTEETLATFLMSLVTIIAYVLVVITAIGTIGVNTTSIAALLAAGGMAIGMALSGTVQNFAGGIMLLIFKPFKVGDFIQAQSFSGTVTAVTIVNTKIRTPDNRLVVIPNGALSNGNIDNYSALSLRRVDWTVSVEYGTDADECIAVLRSILEKDTRILDSKTAGAADIFVALSSMNENDISFVVRAWVKVEDYWNVYFDHNKDFYTILPQHGFSFAFPHMDVTIKK